MLKTYNVVTLIAFVATLLVGGVLEAQTTIGGDVKPKRALRLTISGDLSLSFVDRSSSFGDAALGANLLAAGRMGALKGGYSGSSSSACRNRS